MVASEWLTLQINSPNLKLLYNFHSQQASYIMLNFFGGFTFVNGYGYLLSVLFLSQKRTSTLATKGINGVNNESTMLNGLKLLSSMAILLKVFLIMS
jgi:hypothetical protein